MLESEVILLAVKPQVISGVISEIADTVGEQISAGCLPVSIISFAVPYTACAANLYA